MPDRVRMPLLTLVTQSALDEDYEHAARRRTAGTGSRPVPAGPALRRHLGAVVVVTAFGLLLALAAVQNSRDAGTQNASRAALIKRIEARKRAVATQEREIGALRRQNARLQKQSPRLGDTVRGAQDRLSQLEVATGFGTVHGAGVSFSVDDNPDGTADGRVRASDLRLLVNGLWAAGADAVAINGRRLTTLSSIVNAGISVQVNRLPTSPPYVVIAIGQQKALLGSLTTTTTGVTFAGLAASFGFGLERREVGDLTMGPAPATQLPLRYAIPLTSGPPDHAQGDPAS